MLGAARASIQGGAIAVKAFVGTIIAKGLGLVESTPAQLAMQGGYIFFFAASYHFWDYLSTTPLPEPCPAPEVQQPSNQATKTS